MYRHNNHNQYNRYKRGGNFNRGGRKTPVYDPALFIQKATEYIAEEYTPVHSFSDFQIHQILKQNIVSKGYKDPTPIQDSAIPPLLEGKNVVGVATTGTGKTAAFLIPLINKVLNDNHERVLIITPTRELAIQIEQEFRDFARGTQIQSVICIGGVGIGGQIQSLRRNPNFVVGTPGRLKDLERQRILNFGLFKSIVLDEVDRMLDMGFIVDITYIVSRLAHLRHSLFFSATLPEKVQRVMKQFVREPIIISVKSQATPANVNQDIVRLNGREKIDVLGELLANRDFEKVLVFGRTKRGIDKVACALNKRRVTVATIHGNKSQGQRQRALESFKNNKVQVLLATDIASRGLDIKDVTHVINYDLPGTYEDYIHRIGRTGRINKRGNALTFV
ncbi:DEAD/DEAH box helicase [Patescibacteria group bacterium]|nr:DEAD/DEAH box helicase [Patescibacteria group bacterium]